MGTAFEASAFYPRSWGAGCALFVTGAEMNTFGVIRSRRGVPGIVRAMGGGMDHAAALSIKASMRSAVSGRGCRPFLIMNSNCGSPATFRPNVDGAT